MEALWKKSTYFHEKSTTFSMMILYYILNISVLCYTKVVWHAFSTNYEQNINNKKRKSVIIEIVVFVAV